MVDVSSSFVDRVEHRYRLTGHVVNVCQPSLNQGTYLTQAKSHGTPPNKNRGEAAAKQAKIQD